MRRILPSSDVVRILDGLQSFRAPGVVPGDVPLEPTDTLLGVLAFEGHIAAVLLDRGAYLQIEGDWCLVPYASIDVKFPPEENPNAPLTLIAPQGSVEMLFGTSDVRQVGRFFMKCAQDASVSPTR